MILVDWIQIKCLLVQTVLKCQITVCVQNYWLYCTGTVSRSGVPKLWYIPIVHQNWVFLLQIMVVHILLESDVSKI